jgi:uncharacterized RDD family membrane protein YckC
MERDPYAAPTAAIDDVHDRLSLVPASRWRRFANLLVDYIGLALLGMILGMAVVLVGGNPALQALNTPNPLRDMGFGIVTALLYYTPLEAFFGCTLGKLVTGTRVVDERGGAITWKQALGRTVCRFIPFEAFSVLFSSDDPLRGWHDRLPRTFVVLRRGVADSRRSDAIAA